MNTVDAVRLVHQANILSKETSTLRRLIADKYVADPIHDSDSDSVKNLKGIFFKNIEHFEIELSYKQRQLDELLR